MFSACLHKDSASIAAALVASLAVSVYYVLALVSAVAEPVAAGIGALLDFVCNQHSHLAALDFVCNQCSHLAALKSAAILGVAETAVNLLCPLSYISDLSHV